MPEVKVPELAESITEGTIAEWLKQVGDSVDKGEAIVELETLQKKLVYFKNY